MNATNMKDKIAVVCVVLLFSVSAFAGARMRIQRDFSNQGQSDPFQLKPRAKVKVEGDVQLKGTDCSWQLYHGIQVSLEAFGTDWTPVEKRQFSLVTDPHNPDDRSLPVRFNLVFSAKKTGSHRITITPLKNLTPNQPCTFTQSIAIDIP